MVLYHATSKENLDGIIEQGILACYSGQRFPEYSKPGCTYGTTRKVRYWVPLDPGTHSVIIKFDVPDAIAEQIVRVDRNFSYSDSRPEREIHGDVLPEWLVDYEYVTV